MSTDKQHEYVKAEIEQAIGRIREASSQEELWKAHVQYLGILAKCQDYLSDEGKVFLENQSKKLMELLAEHLAAQPDTIVTREIKRLMRGARGERLHAEVFLKALESPMSSVPPFYTAIRPIIINLLQRVMDLLQDASQDSMTGSVSFAVFYLIGLCIEESVVGFHLVQHGYAGQALTHIRTAAEALDLMDLFMKEPQWADEWMAGDKGKWWELKPKKVREKLNKDDVFGKLYGKLSRLGTHPSPEGLQARVRQTMKNPRGDRPAFVFRIGGTIHGMEGIVAHLSLVTTLLDLLIRIYQVFGTRLNAEEVLRIIQQAMKDFNQFLGERLITPLKESGMDVTEFESSLKKTVDGIEAEIAALETGQPAPNLKEKK